MSNLLIGISGMSSVVAGLIAIFFDPASIYFWIFVILSIPFGMLIAGIVFTTIGTIGEVLLTVFTVLDQLDEKIEDREHDDK